LRGKPNNPKKWNSTTSNTNTGALPIDKLALSSIEFHQNYSLNTIDSGPFQMSPADISKATLKKWKTDFPPPEYYDFEFTTKPHPFMSLNKFISGRFHQFRVLKSYLAAHQSWHNENLSTRCPRCYEEEEDLYHALLACPARSASRAEFIPELTAIEDIWNSPSNTAKVAQYLRATKTGYPPEVSGWFPCSPTASFDNLSEVDSISSSIFSLQAMNVRV
jgi:hypothetical protein